MTWGNIRKNIEQYSAYPNRFLENESGAEAARWLYSQVQDVVSKANKAGVTVELFPHAAFPQNSIIARVPGKSNRTVIIGGHLDSINQADRYNGRAPGADDNASGSFTILEAFRVLLTDTEFDPSQLENTVEFHWYAAEEGGLRGSQDIFTQYAAAGRDVWAMLQQGKSYSKTTLDANTKQLE